MKKLFTISFFVLTIYFISFSSAFAASSVKVNILYHNSRPNYLYTTDKNEVSVLKSRGWKEVDFIKWYAPTYGTPVYRCYHPASARHLYTLDRNEVDVICATQGWVRDNGGQPVFYSGGTVPIYRSFDLKNGFHKFGPLLYIKFVTEQYDPVPKAVNEGIKMYAVSASCKL